MLELREKNGPGAIADLLTEPIKNSQSKVIIIDGVRSTAEIEVLKNARIRQTIINRGSQLILATSF